MTSHPLLRNSTSSVRTVLVRICQVLRLPNSFPLVLSLPIPFAFALGLPTPFPFVLSLSKHRS